jgi:RNA polymerase sigma-70 factor, ECF subfamily
MNATREKEFTQLIAQTRGIIFKVIRLYVSHPEDERDLYQEIVYQAWKSFSRFEGRSKFSTWLYRIGLNTVLTFRRRPAIIDSKSDLSYLQVAADTPSPETEVLYLAIRSLNEIDRMIVTLHLDGYDNEEIADISGLSKNNVAVRLHRIREALTKKIKAL